MAGTSSRHSELSVSRICLVASIREMDIHGLAKYRLREQVGSGRSKIKTIISMMTIELD